MSELFKSRVFLVVAGADLLQQAGIWIRNMALLFYIMEQTNNNPAAVALLTTFEYLPIFVFSLIGGTFADRWCWAACGKPRSRPRSCPPSSASFRSPPRRCCSNGTCRSGTSKRRSASPRA
jgi:MFS family permease